jgi:hypothetical protein
MLRGLALRDASGNAFDPYDYGAFRTWLLNANATNMAYMLSAQLAAMELNVWNGLVDGSRLVYAPGVAGANVNGFLSVNALMSKADASLGVYGVTMSDSPARAQKEALKNALDNANNDRTFVQLSPASCPAPVFP